MIELELRDGRVLAFDQGAGRSADPKLDALREGDVAGIRTDDLPDSRGLRTGPDFILSHPSRPDATIAVELKAGLATLSPKNGSLGQLQKYRKDLLVEYGHEVPLQLWLLTRDGRSLRIWIVDERGGLRDEREYHLAQVSSRASDASDAMIAGESGVTTQGLITAIEDWENKIRVLFATIRDWCHALGPDILADETHTVTMDEELMRRYAVPTRELPVLLVYNAAEDVLTFKPYGLWVIGAYGRVDVFSSHSNYFLVDRAPKFKPSRWELFGSSSTKFQGRRLVEGVNFTNETFEALLRGKA